MSIFKSNGLKRRAIYKYICTECGNSRASFIYERALGKVCMACQKNKPNENQPELFLELESDDQFYPEPNFTKDHIDALKMDIKPAWLVNQGQGGSVEMIQEVKINKNGALVDQRLLTKDGQILRDWQHEETAIDYALKKTAEARAEHQEEQKNKQYNQVLDAEVEGEQTKRDQFFAKHGGNITVQKEVVEEDVVLFTFNDRAGLYVTGEYFRWKVVDFFANAEYFMDDLPLVYSAGLEVDLLLAKQ